jgi:hypothetical protein
MGHIVACVPLAVTFKELILLPTECICVLTINSNCFPKSINRLVFVMGMTSVFCEVRTEFLYTV